MKMNKKNAKVMPGKGWAWKIWNEEKDRWELCHWVTPTKYNLSTDEKPSPEAQKIYVKILPNKEPRE